MVLKNGYNTISKKQQKLKIKDQSKTNFESFKKNLVEKIEVALKEIDEGNYIPAEQGFREMEEKYGIYD